MFNDILEVHYNTLVKIQHTWHTHIAMGARRGGGGQYRRLPSPPMENQTFFCHMGGLLATFSPCGGLCYVSLLGGGGGLFPPCESSSTPFFSMGGLLRAGAHAHYLYYITVMLKCINIQIDKITVIIPTHIYMHILL